MNYCVIPEYDLIERYAEIVNVGTNNIILESTQSAAWVIPYLQDYRLTHVAGKWAGEFQLRDTVISEGKKLLESRRGFTDAHAKSYVIDNLPGAWSGKSLLNIGIELHLRGDFDSLLYRLRGV